MKSFVKSIFSNKLPLLFVLLWGTVQCFILKQNGIISDLEATKYILNANSLIENGSYSLSYILYSTYIVFLAISFKLQLGYNGIVIIQLILNAIATYKLSQLTKTISGKKSTAYISILLFILFYHIQVWNFHLYTDSFFLSLLIIFMEALINTNLKKWKGRIKLIILFILVFFARPVGVLLLPPILIYFATKTESNLLKSKLIIYSFIFLVFISIASIYLNKSQLIYNGLFQAFPSNKILCGFDSGLENFKLTENNSTDIFFNIILFLKISVIKLTHYFGMIRPFNSLNHNLILIAFYPIYIFSIIGFSSKVIRKEYKYFFLLIITLFSLLAVITCVNWHGRFMLPILPSIIIFGAIGLEKIIQSVFYKSH